jgi:tight adherence protein B
MDWAGPARLACWWPWRSCWASSPCGASCAARGPGRGPPQGVWRGRAGARRRGRSRRRRAAAWPTVTRLLAGFGLGPRLALALARADLPLTAAEFALIVVWPACWGFARWAACAAACWPAWPWPACWGRCRSSTCAAARPPPAGLYRAVARRADAAHRRPAGRLRADPGHGDAGGGAAAAGLVEFGRVMRAVELGLPVQRALSDMAQRVGSDDLDLVVTAITVQYEMGGNLAQTLETIGETVRERIRMLREVRVLTAQQRSPAMCWPPGPCSWRCSFTCINAGLHRPPVAPGWIRLLPVACRPADRGLFGHPPHRGHRGVGPMELSSCRPAASCGRPLTFGLLVAWPWPASGWPLPPRRPEQEVEQRLDGLPGAGGRHSRRRRCAGPLPAGCCCPCCAACCAWLGRLLPRRNVAGVQEMLVQAGRPGG